MIYTSDNSITDTINDTNTNPHSIYSCEGMSAWSHGIYKFLFIQIRITYVRNKICPVMATYRVHMRCTEGHTTSHLQCDEHTEWAIRQKIMCSVPKCKSFDPMTVVLKQPLKN